MEKIEQNELQKTVGGVNSVSGTLISALNTLIKSIYTMGQGVGGALRRFVTKKTCACN